MENDNTYHILFCNIAYMKYYDGIIAEDIPQNGGRYVNETNDALEKDNFHVCEDGYCRGFVETKYKKGYLNAEVNDAKQIHIERIDKEYKKLDAIENVTVVFCAKSNEIGHTVIVGFYKNATVLRRREQYKGRQYNIFAKDTDCVLLDEKDRIINVPRARNDGFGFGQANVWYADSDIARDYIRNNILPLIERNQMFLSNYELQNEDNLYENGNGKKILVNKYERNPQARKICIEKYGSICAICGFDASKIYGVEFKGKIEVHHIIPISEMNENYKINPEHDLIPLCPNCHMAIHTKINGKTLSLDELKKRVKK